jgi:ATP-dependent Clp protease ATP-binding subunit ClpE
MLLQVLEDGRLTDSHGKVISFENTVIIMTSNAGTNMKSNGIGFSNEGYKALETTVRSVLKETFRPEFLNRVDETIVFTELSKDELKKIIDLMLLEVEEDVKANNMTITVSDEAKEFILEKGYDVKYGARPLRRTIQKYIEDELAEAFLKGIFKEGSRVCVSVEQGEIKLKDC